MLNLMITQYLSRFEGVKKFHCGVMDTDRCINFDTVQWAGPMV